MKVPLGLGMFLTYLVYQAGQTPFYVGAWQLDENKTLASLLSQHEIPAEERLMLRDNINSDIVHVLHQHVFTTYPANRMPEQLKFTPHKVEILGDTTIRTTYFSRPHRADIVQILTFEGDCYYVRSSKWQFKEYYCRVE
ncbi:hypothetical protein WCN91_10805 [Pseudoalteromonas sp. YIC-827]|uniref:DUF4440 domain-containing protein n=1 Tax=Pseudoalteromonas qingdaonensis TaxID=3131913 RepID=A0ABU9MXB4_9GAMM